MMKNCRKIINVENLKFNILLLKSKLNKDTKFCAVVKSNAYGHNYKIVCPAICDLVDCFAVSTNDEAIKVRKICKNRPCIVLSPLSTDNLKTAILRGATFSVQSIRELDTLNLYAKKLNAVAFFHLQINTGMNRFGINCENFKTFMEHTKTLHNIHFTGIYSHLGAGEHDDLRTRHQADEFLRILSKLDTPVIRHLCNTQNALTHPQYQLDMVRVGLGIYGYADKSLKPVMQVRAKIVAIQDVKKGEYIGYGLEHIASRDMRIAVLSIGYAHGLPRAWANGGKVKIRGRFAQIVANICMEATIVEIGDIPAKIGDYAAILCDIPALNAEIIASECKTIPYEILTNFDKI